MKSTTHARLTCLNCGQTIVRPKQEVLDYDSEWGCWVCNGTNIIKEKLNPRSMRIHQHPSQIAKIKKNKKSFHVVV